MSHLPGKFVWFEHHSSDQDSASRFYEQLFGWATAPITMGEMRYAMIQNKGEGIGGYGAAEPGQASWRSYLSVADVDASCAAASAAGAGVLMPPTDFGPVGRAALIQDPGSARLSLWKSNDGDPADSQEIVHGRFCWNELYVDDPAAVVGFYERLIGYSHDAMDMGPVGTYWVLKTGGLPRAGVMRRPGPELAILWVPYVSVADADATAARASALGATVCMPPMDIPGVGRSTMFVDPAGAMLAAIALIPPAGN